MKIITVGGIKGGTGKSTIALNLAAYFCDLATLIDADEQQTLKEWEFMRDYSKQPKFPIISATASTLLHLISEKKLKTDLAIIDVGGRDTQTFRAALTISDLLILPFRPRPFDLGTVDKLERMTKEVRNFNESLIVLPIINQADSRGKSTQETRHILNSVKEWTQNKISLGYRKGYYASAGEGSSVIESPKYLKAYDEMFSLCRKSHELVFNISSRKG